MMKMKKRIVAVVLCGVLASAQMAAPVQAASKVYVTGSRTQSGKVYGVKYHKRKSCRSLKRSKHNIIKISLKSAKKQGYKKCKICWR